MRRRVEELLETGEAAWCPIVRLELWNGARGESERAVLREMDEEIASLDISAAVWDRAVTLASSGRAERITVPVTDILVAACAKHHGVALEHCDGHFDHLSTIESHD